MDSIFHSLNIRLRRGIITGKDSIISRKNTSFMIGISQTSKGVRKKNIVSR